MLSTDHLLRKSVLGIWVMLIAIPVAFPLGSKFEGGLLPVVKQVKIDPVVWEGHNMKVRVSFNKVRSCEFKGLNWYDAGNRDIRYSFNEAKSPQTRPAGEQILTVSWTLLGVNSLDGLRAEVIHRCHPLWLTVTRFYP